MTSSTSAQSICPKALPFARSEAAEEPRTQTRKSTQKNAGCITRIRHFWLLDINVAPKEQPRDVCVEDKSLENRACKTQSNAPIEEAPPNVAQRNRPPPQQPHAFIQSAP